jgi:hypothetical protein
VSNSSFNGAPIDHWLKIFMLCKLQHGKIEIIWYLQSSKAWQVVECVGLDWCNLIIIQNPTKYKICTKYNGCEFSIYICSNIPATPADGVYVSELKRYSASSGSPSWIWLSFIESVLQINTDMIAGHFICLRSWLVTMCDIWPASA